MRSKTKIKLFILCAIAIIIITVTIQITVIMEKAQKDFFNLYGESRLKVVENYIKDYSEELDNYINDYARWDDAFDHVEKEDSKWLQNNITKYLYETDFFGIDVVYLSKKNNTYIEYYGEELSISQLENTNVYKKSLKENKMSHEYVVFDHTVYDVVVSPITTEDQNKSNGMLLLAKKIDKKFLDHLKLFAVRDHLEKINIIKQHDEKLSIVHKKNKIEIYQPIKNKEDEIAWVRAVYDLSDLNHFKYDIFKEIMMTFIFYSLIAGVIVTILMDQEMKKIYEVILQIHSIAKGDYKKRLEEKGSYEVIELSKSVNKLSKEIEMMMLRQEENYLESIKALVTSLEVKDAYTKGHSERVAFYAYHLGKNIGYKDLRILSNAALVHDIGKIAIPDRILNKPGKLTEEEYEVIKKHPDMGYKILNASNMFHDIKYMIKYHHERYDGKGYPDQIKGENIPLGARILAVADVFDALTSNRSYRKAMSLDEAMKIIKDGVGTHFDPYLVEVFEEIIHTMQENGEIHCTEMIS
ncbi:HD domain-containing phosphohydrolase [Inediibacterium massiliense]|uniref:HD domain-containing phosphohydrolase n=1 Tax=Inediibacterium massiliense TaxID=1658111 RepID=UPI0006B6402A|nr:HD domain-containing phosphohydrolase [Inediibacterium massiliense]